MRVSVTSDNRTQMTQIGHTVASVQCIKIHSHNLVSCANTHAPRSTGTRANYALAIQESHRPYERSW